MSTFWEEFNDNFQFIGSENLWLKTLISGGSGSSHFLTNTEYKLLSLPEGRRERKQRSKWISQEQTWDIAFDSLYLCVIIPSYD